MSTEVIVTDKNNTVVLEHIENRTIVSGMIAPQTTFASLADIDLTQLTPGSVLVYNDTTKKWTATILLDKQIVESGQY
jgi:hypothetical protein